MKDARTLARIKSLVIPPAWTEVWICARPDGHIQATGRDARGRKQYRYHARWREHRDASKYDQLIEFGRALKRVRERVAHDLAQPALTREKVLAAIVRLLERTLIRVGNDEYARANHSYGLTTLREDHVEFSGATVRFDFRGKSGVERKLAIKDPQLARVVKRCQDLPGQALFQYVDENGKRRKVGSADVNAYLREASGLDFTAKSFRTWGGTLRVMRALGEAASNTKSAVIAAIKAAAQELGNTATVCRKYYVHPAILVAFERGELRRVRGDEERALLGLLARYEKRPRSHAA